MKRLVNIAVFIFLSQICTGQVMLMFSSDSLSNITSPLDVDSLFYWFAADVGVTDSLGGAIATDEGVGTWNDLSGNGRDVARVTDGPIWKANGGPGSNPCIVFHPTDATRFLRETDSTYWSSDEITIFAVLKYTNATASQFDTWFNRDIAGGKQFTFLGRQSGEGYRNGFWTTADGATLIYDDFTAKETTWRLLSYVVNAGTNTSSFWVDSSTQAINANGTQTGIYDTYSKTAIGIRGVSISEIIVYSRALTTTERTAIENYLNVKYDLY